MLAWLDHCAQREIRFDEAVLLKMTEALQEACARESMMTFENIEKKLSDLSKSSTRACNLGEITKRGSKCFTQLSTQTCDDIAHAVKAYETDENDCDDKVAHQSSTTQTTSLDVASAENKAEEASRDHGSEDAPPDQSQEKSRLQSSGTRKHLKDLLLQKELELQRVTEKWELEVYNLNEQVTKLKRAELDLQAENTHLINARNMRNKAGRDPLEELLFAKDEEIWTLRHKNHQIQKLANFAQQLYPSNKHVQPQKIEDEMSAIASGLELLLVGHDLDQGMLVPSLIEGTDLDKLARSIFDEPGSELNSQHKLKLKFCISRYGPGVLLKALSMAALRDWVFEAGLLNFSPKDSRLLDAYRNAIFLHDGWTRLRNIELAAYDDLLGKEHFKMKLIPRKAYQLAARLSRALAPLVSRSSSKKDDEFETWGQDDIVWKDRQYRMTEMFEAALRLMVAMMGNDEVYELVLSPPATSKDVDQDDVKGHSFAFENAAPQFWQLGTLYSYPSEVSSKRGCLSDALVQSSNFIRKMDGERSNSLYQKAILVSRMEYDVLEDIDSSVYTSTGSDSSRSMDMEQDDSTAAEDTDISAVKISMQRKRKILVHSSAFLCKICGRSFKLLGSLQNHTRRDKRARCLPCQITFKYFSELREHIKKEHRQKENDNAENLHTTSDQLEGSAKPECKHCRRTFSSSSNLRVHLNNHVCKNFHLKCRACSCLFGDSATMQKHEKDIHLKTMTVTQVEKRQLVLGQQQNQLQDQVWGPGMPEPAMIPGSRRFTNPVGCNKCGNPYWYTWRIKAHQAEHPHCEREGNFKRIQQFKKRYASTEYNIVEHAQSSKRRRMSSASSHTKSEGPSEPFHITSKSAVAKAKSLCKKGFGPTQQTSPSPEQATAPRVSADYCSTNGEGCEIESDKPCTKSDSKCKTSSCRLQLQATKDIFKCPVCAKEFSEHGLKLHIQWHPLCLRLGNDHVIGKKDQAASKKEAACEICGQILTRRKIAAVDLHGDDVEIWEDLRNGKVPTSIARRQTAEDKSHHVIKEKGRSTTSKSRYKYPCFVCLEEFDTESDCSTHFMTHPHCLRAQTGHMIGDDDLATELAQVKCTVCDSTLIKSSGQQPWKQRKRDGSVDSFADENGNSNPDRDDLHS